MTLYADKTHIYTEMTRVTQLENCGGGLPSSPAYLVSYWVHMHVQGPLKYSKYLLHKVRCNFCSSDLLNVALANCNKKARLLSSIECSVDTDLASRSGATSSALSPSSSRQQYVVYSYEPGIIKA